MKVRMTATAILAAMMAGSIAQAQQVDEFDQTLYAETRAKTALFTKDSKDGTSVYVKAVELPAESIISIDVVTLNETLQTQKTSPDRVNGPLLQKSTDDILAAQKSQNGMVCGVTIVDVNDDEIREEEDLMRDDFCLSISEVPRLSVLDANGSALKDAVLRFQAQKDDQTLVTVAAHVQRKLEAERDLIYEGILEVSGSGVISPLKGCGKGCLSVSSEYGRRFHPVYKRYKLHKGIDLRARTGTPVVAVQSGRILANRTERRGKKMKGYGHYTIVVHPGSRMQTLYAHLSKHMGRAGQPVNQGQVVGLSGATGVGTGPHLHFETHKQGRGGYYPFNPRTFIKSLLGHFQNVLKVFDLNA